MVEIVKVYVIIAWRDIVINKVNVWAAAEIDSLAENVKVISFYTTVYP